MRRLKYKETEVLLTCENWTSLESAYQSIGMLECSNIDVLVDENIHRLYPHLFNDSVIIIPSGEQSKSLNQVENIMNQLLENGADRSSLLIGIGGGVVCDITGFVASTFMRGVQFGFIPTTLLSMLDASIGGKNGVNIGRFKNMMGTINQPDFIVANLNFLKTLDKNELISGMAEAIKHACIQSADHFEFIEQNHKAILELDFEKLELMLLQSMQIKMNIVEEDERESGKRKLLNYGHTYGHAIEKMQSIPHGFAVSYGMMMANTIAMQQTGLMKSETDRIAHLLRSVGLPTDHSSINRLELEPIIINDKKKQKNHIDFILLEQIGKGSIHPLKINQLR